MLLNIAGIIYTDGGRLPFEETYDFSEFEFNGEKPVDEPVKVKGEVVNRAGVLTVTGTITTVIHPHCDRCMKPLEKPVSIPIEAVAAEALSDEATDNIFLLQGDNLDVDEIVTTLFVLSQDTKNLCGDNCQGICPGCGADLNAEPCRCKKQTDPRLAALSQLLKDKD